MSEKIQTLIHTDCQCEYFCCDRCELLEKKLRHAAKCIKYADVWGCYDFWKNIDLLRMGNVALMIIHEWDFDKNGSELKTRIMNIVRSRINRGHDPSSDSSETMIDSLSDDDSEESIIVSDESNIADPNASILRQLYNSRYINVVGVTVMVLGLGWLVTNNSKDSDM